MEYTVSLRALKAILIAVVLAVSVAIAGSLRVTAFDCEDEGGEPCCQQVGESCQSTEDCGGFTSPCTCKVFTTQKCAERD